MSDVIEKIKRIKILGKLLLGIGTNKIILKDFDKPNEHLTILFKPNFIMDVHKTKEGSEKEYESLGMFDLKKSIQKIVSDPSMLESGFTEFVKSAREINFEEPEFADNRIFNPKTLEELLTIVKKKRKDYIIPAESAEEFFPFKDTIPWKEAKGKVKEYAFVLNKEGFPVGVLIKIQTKMMLISINIMENPLVSKLLSIMTTPEKFEPEEHHDNHGKD